MKKNQVGSAAVKKMRWLDRSVLAFVALVAFAGTIVGRVSAQTVGWWGFEGTPGRTAGIGTVFSNRVDSSRLPAEVYARYEGAASTDYQPVFADSIFDPYSMGDTETSFASHSTLRFANSHADASRSQGCPVRVSDTDGALDLQTFTLEGWFKMDPGNTSVGWRALFSKGYGDNASGGKAYTFALYVDGNGQTNQQFNAYFCTKDADGSIKFHEMKAFSGGRGNMLPLRDGNWHYVSLVVNGTTHLAHLFFDFNSEGKPFWAGQVDLGGEDLAYNSEEPLVIGGNNLSHWQYCGGIDEVRLSDATINTEPEALKKRGIPDGTVIGHFHLEDDCRSSVWANYWPEAELSAATGGAVPTFVSLGKEKCLCDVNKVRTDDLVDTNCLNISKGKVCWTNPQLLKDSADALTVEFFIQAKASENSDWAGIVRADTTVDGTAGGTLMLPWNLSRHLSGTGGDVAFRIDTPTAVNQSTCDVKIPLDGGWHHVALRMKNIMDDGAKKVEYEVFVDYQPKAKNTANGWTSYPGTVHMGFGLAGTPFTGKIDEFRLTKGVLSSDDFLRLKGTGGAIIIFR